MGLAFKAIGQNMDAARTSGSIRQPKNRALRYFLNGREANA